MASNQVEKIDMSLGKLRVLSIYFPYLESIWSPPVYIPTRKLVMGEVRGDGTVLLFHYLV